MSPQRNTKEVILQTSMLLFWKNSYEAVGVERICREAGVKKGSFYHFFSSKEVLAGELIEWMGKHSEEEFLKPIFMSDRPALQKFTDYATAMGEMLEALKTEHGAEDYPGCPFGNLVAEMGTKSELIREKLKSVLDTKLYYFKHAILEGQQDGTVTTNLSADALTQLIMTHWQGSAIICKAHNDCEQFMQNLQNILSLMQSSK